MLVKVLSVLVISSAILATISAHPMKKTDVKDKLAETVKSKEVPTKLHEQEKELEDLAKLQKDKVNNAIFQSLSDVKIAENNGLSEKIVKTLDNVVDGNNGKIVSSVKKIRKIGVAKGRKPKVEAKTEVDIPAEGIHNTFQDNLFENEGQEQKKATLRRSFQEDTSFEASHTGLPGLIKSSKSMARYLLDTGNFYKVDEYLSGLISAGIISKTDASEYKQMLFEYYQKLVEGREAEELQRKLDAPPLGYDEQDYMMPFNNADDTLNNRISPYGQMDTASEEDNSRYGEGEGEEEEEEEDSNEDGYPLDTGIDAQPEYIDVPTDAIEQPSNKFQDLNRPELVPLNFPTIEWLTGLMVNAKSRENAQAQSNANTLPDSQPSSLTEQEKIQRVIDSVLARNALKSLEELSKIENKEERNMKIRLRERMQERMRERSRINGRLPSTKIVPIALSKRTSALSSERRDKNAEVKKQAQESKRKSA